MATLSKKGIERLKENLPKTPREKVYEKAEKLVEQHKGKKKKD